MTVVVQVPPTTVPVAPFELVRMLVTVTPGDGTKPLPVLFETVTVNVCGVPTWFVEFGAIVISASTQFLLALALSLTFASPVVRWTVSEPKVYATFAFTAVFPVVVELVSVTVQLPVASTVVQLAAESKPGPEATVKSISVPAGAFTKPVPSLTLT